MGVSVVICAYTMDRWDDLVAAVRSCTVQTLKPEEVVVVVDHNETLFKRATLDLPGIRVIANDSAKGLSGARNTGVAASSGDVIAFLDDDAYAEPEWLERLMIPMADSAVVGVGGWVLPGWQDDSPAWFPESFYWILGCSYSGLPAHNAQIRNPIGANMAMRRKVFASVGGFTLGLGRIGRVPLGCEETELCIRYCARYSNERFVLVRDAIVHHRVPTSRLTWHYFWTRCWAEGISKAAVSSLVGAGSGLASERRHLARSLPIEVATSVRSLLRHPRSASIRTALIVAGTACAVAGLLKGRLSLRRNPLLAGDGSQQLLTIPGDNGGTRLPATREAGQ